ncbi:hypothetical protein IW140_003753 [Coemansia sp. RSA 1813]|nr:hypothetical protein EV178_003533 [Coemansia sp. RSA 1646]KAJ1772782.1 hypothetical protein LPJ74_001121 [Coemansia sp. RSA 1843]KAJ2213147.1 hypothetical protein EV179_004117 [Coemansia sp. RSA 487]KAJ2568547.1 hypothetical protein IW140_003753 [Coemansia sp. RSA 1813]
MSDNRVSGKPAADSTPITIEQLRASFGNGSPTVVCESLIAFLRLESRSNGNTRLINEISESVSKLLYPWFQNSETMRNDEQQSLYTLLRPDGLFVDTLLQYHTMQRERRSNTVAGESVDCLVVQAASLPVEYHTNMGADINTGMGIPADISKRLLITGKSKEIRATGFNTNALEYFLYHFCKALVPPRENAADPVSNTALYPRRSASVTPLRHGASVFGSAVHSLTREYICFFLPVAIPELSLPTGGDLANDYSAITQIRSKLHDFSPKKALGGTQAKREQSRRPGIPCVDILDVMAYSHSLDLASFFASCVSLLWLPAIPTDVREAVLRQITSSSSANWVWIPSISHLASLNLFHLAVGYLAKGERQMERFYLTGAVSPNSPTDNSTSRKKTGVDAYEKRISMNGTIRDTLRTRCFTTPIADTLGMALSSCGRAGVADTDIWIPFLDTMVSVWIRYIMPWRGSKTEPSAPSTSTDISQVWRSRIPFIVKGLPSVLYSQTFAYFVKQMASPQIDLLTNAATFMDEGCGISGGGHGRSALGPSAGSGLPLGSSQMADALTVVERVASAFTGTELRAVLAAIERCQLDAYPRIRGSLVSDSSTPHYAAAEMQGTLDMQTPTKAASSMPHGQQSPFIDEHSRQTAFETQVASAQTLLAPYMQEIAACSSGSRLFDTVIVGSFGVNPPLCLVFGRPTAPPYAEMIVRALYAAELLSERQLRLLVPMRGADEARSLVSDIFMVLSRIFSASNADISSSSVSIGGAGFSTSVNEKMRARAQALHDAQARINSLYGKLAAVFGTTRKEIEAIKHMQENRVAMDSSDGSTIVADVSSHQQQFSASSGFGERLAARGRLLNERGGTRLTTPDMDHGSLTPRGRWELKTGRKKFTAQSLLSSSGPLATSVLNTRNVSMGGRQNTQDQMLPQTLSFINPGDSAERIPHNKLDAALLPRGPRAYYIARSYESQWILDYILPFNVWINDKYQHTLNALEAAAYPIPSAMRSYKLDFRFLAAYQNLRFFALVFAIWRILSWLFF